MKFKLLAVLLCISSTLFSIAQNSANNAFAITSKISGSHEWTEVKEINLSNGEVIRNIFENSNQYTLFDGRSSKVINIGKLNDSTGENVLHPFYGLSAACAFDAKTNRLYYTPMFLNQLRYIDLNAGMPRVYLFRNEPFSTASDVEAEENQVTRMVIASDGNGYAMTNNGRHLVTFTTSAKPVITDLGSVHDAPENGEMSIHDANTSWGGDLLADASGKLYVITAHNHVFKIDVQTRTATYVTKIKGLPESFTTNGAVVNEEGNVMVSSANYLTAYYSVDPHAWQATSIEPRQQVYNTSDLANGNLLYKTNFVTAEAANLKQNISVYPNPVRTKMFRVNFENQKSGKYNIQLVDVTGRLISDKTIALTSGTQSSEMKVDPSLTKGTYFVKVLNHLDREIFTQKIVLQ